MAKYIFDFDSTLFFTDELKKVRASYYEELGINKEEHDKLISESMAENNNLFSLKKLIALTFKKYALKNISQVELYEKIMAVCQKSVNQDLLNIVFWAGKNNCYIATKGDEEFQMAKIEKSGIKDFFLKIFITSNSKKQIIENICAQFPNEPVFFIDNKEEVFSDLNFKKYPNLKTILYTGQKLDFK